MSCEKIEDLPLNNSKYRECFVKKTISNPKKIKIKSKIFGPNPKKLKQLS